MGCGSDRLFLPRHCERRVPRICDLMRDHHLIAQQHIDVLT